MFQCAGHLQDPQDQQEDTTIPARPRGQTAAGLRFLCHLSLSEQNYILHNFTDTYGPAHTCMLHSSKLPDSNDKNCVFTSQNTEVAGATVSFSTLVWI